MQTMDYSQISMATLWVWGLIGLVLGIVALVAMWKVFKKAGYPGWACLVPGYNMYVMYKIAFGNAKLFWITLAMAFATGLMTSLFGANDGTLAAPVLIVLAICAIFGFVVGIMLQFKLAKAFGQGVGFGFGLLFLYPIFMCILGFGSAKYVGLAKAGQA